MIGGFIGNPIGGRLAVEADNLQTVTANATVAASTTTSIVFSEIINMGVNLVCAFGAMAIGKKVNSGVDLSVSRAKAVAFAVTMAVDVAALTVKNAGKLLIGIGVDIAVEISSGLAVLITSAITAGVSLPRRVGKRVTALLDVLALVVRKLRPDRIKAAISAGFARSTISRR